MIVATEDVKNDIRTWTTLVPAILLSELDHEWLSMPLPDHRGLAAFCLVSSRPANASEPNHWSLAMLREYAGRRGWQIVEEFTDQGVSGCKESRPALNRLMSDACRRRFDAILVWKIDRFGRSLKHLVNSLAELAALGVAFISLRDNSTETRDSLSYGHRKADCGVAAGTPVGFAKAIVRTRVIGRRSQR
jgi:hypothetical protein